MKKQNLTTNETRQQGAKRTMFFSLGRQRCGLGLISWRSCFGLGERGHIYYTAILPLLNLAAFLICVLHDFCMIHVLLFYAQKQIGMFCCGQKRGKLETQSFLSIAGTIVHTD